MGKFIVKVDQPYLRTKLGLPYMLKVPSKKFSFLNMTGGQLLKTSTRQLSKGLTYVAKLEAKALRFLLDIKPGESCSVKNEWLEKIRKNPLLLKDAPPLIKKDREIVLAAVSKHGWALDYADDSLKKDREIVLAAVSQNGWALAYAASSLQKDRKIVLAAVSQNGWALYYADDSLKKDREIVLAAVSKHGEALAYAASSLQKDRKIVLAAARNLAEGEYAPQELSKEDRVDLFIQMVEKSKEQLSGACNLLKLFSENSIRSRRIIQILDSVNDYNRERILTLLQKDGFYKKINQNKGAADNHIKFHIDILQAFPRLAYPVLEGIIEATQKEIISFNLPEGEQERIKQFVKEMNSFSPYLYQIYLKQGLTGLRELKKKAEKIASDELSFEECKEIVDKYREQGIDGWEILCAVIQIVIPLSGASFVGRGDQTGLLKKMMEAGDLREHVPLAWRGKKKSIALKSGEYVIREGEEIDKAGRIREIINKFRSKDETSRDNLIKAMEEYLRSTQNAEAGREKVREVLYRYASQRDLLGEKIERISGTDYYSIGLLEEIFKDKDHLTTIIVDILKDVNPALLKGEKQPLSGDAHNLITTLNKIWKSEGTQDIKVKGLANIIAKYQEEDVKTKVLNSPRLDPEVKKVIEEVLHGENQVLMSKLKLARDILVAPLTYIQKEKDKFVYKQSEG